MSLFQQLQNSSPIVFVPLETVSSEYNCSPCDKILCENTSKSRVLCFQNWNDGFFCYHSMKFLLAMNVQDGTNA